MCDHRADPSSGTDPKDYLRAIADKEVKWIEKYGKPLENGFPHNIAFPGLKSPQGYLELLRKYMTIAPYLLPQEQGNNLSKPTLRHPGTYIPNSSENEAQW